MKLRLMIPKFKFGIVLSFSILALSLALAPVPGQQKETADYLVRPNLSGARGGNLVVSISEDPATFNGVFVTRVPNAMISDAISADLFHINRRTYVLEPSLAMGFEAANDGRTYTIHLRRGIRFSDGSPFTAEDVVFTLNAMQDPRNASRASDQLQIDDKFPTVAQIDTHTVRFAWPRPVGTGLRALDSIPILPKSLLLKAHPDGALSSSYGPTVPPQAVVGLGAFRLKEYQRGIRVVLERNPYYWKRDKAGQTLPYLDSVTFLIVPDRNAEALRFQAGELDLLMSMNADHFASLRRSDKAGEFTVRDLGPGLGMDLLWFNLNPGKNASGRPFVDPEKRAIFEQASFRQAISFALDRRGIARSVYGGLATPQYGPISSGNTLWHNPGLPATAFDSKRAQALLSQAGLRDVNGDGILEFGSRQRPLEIALLTTRGNAAREKTAEILRQYLAQIGLRVNVQLLPLNELAPRFARTFEYEAILLSNTPTDVVPDLQTDMWYSSGVNHFWYPNQAKPNTSWESEIDALTTRMVQSLEEPVRKKSCFQVQEIWARQLPSIAIVAPDILSGWRNSIGNVAPSILVPYLLWNVEELTKRSR
jgi:peptide/nickel transport system substrate-binding protein